VVAKLSTTSLNIALMATRSEKLELSISFNLTQAVEVSD
jgi:hypothetical protein